MTRITRVAGRVVMVLVAGLCLAVPTSATAAPATYTHTQTIPVPPASNYSGQGGGDGWALAMTPSSVYNVFHHSSTTTVACHRQSDASACWAPKTIQDAGGHNFGAAGQPGLYLDQATGKLYVFGGRDDNTAGVVCFDTAVAETAGNPFCGFTALTAVGGAPLAASTPYISNLTVTGTRLYAMNYVNGANDTGDGNRMMCMDLATNAPCPGQPFAVGVGAGIVSAGNFPAPETALIGGKIYWNMTVGGVNALRCFDTGTNAPCAGAWPQTVTVSPSSVGAPFPLLSAAGAPTGVCLPAGASSPCFALDGTAVTPSAALAAAIPQTSGWNGPAVTIGPRVYIVNGNNNSVSCWDFLADKVCNNFPHATPNASLVYTVNPDPARPDCLWINADNGSAQIQNFDAFSGGACGTGAIRVLSSSFIAPQAQCSPTQYTSLRLVDPARSSYTSGTVTIADASGTPLAGSAPLAIDGNGAVDLTGLPIDPKIGLPQFIIALTGAPAQQSSVTVELSWRADYDAICATPGTQALPDPEPTPTPAPTATPTPTPAPGQVAVLAARAAPKLVGKVKFSANSIRVGRNTTVKVTVTNDGNAASTSGQACVKVSSALVVLKVPKGVTQKGSVLCAHRSAIKPGATSTVASGIVVRGVSPTSKATASDGGNDGVALTSDAVRVLAAQARGGGVTG